MNPGLPALTEQLIKDLKKLKTELPVLLANQAQVYFTKTFKRQGFGGTPWKEVKRRTPGTPEYRWPRPPKASSRTSPINVRTGTLRRLMSNSIRSRSFDSVKLINAAEYATYVNDGTKYAPARPIMGQNQELTKKQVTLINNYLSGMNKK